MTLILTVLAITVIFNILARYIPEDKVREIEHRAKKLKEAEQKKQLYYTEPAVEYRAYIKSTSWYAKRLERLELDNYKCQKCGTEYDLIVHHITYKNLGAETMEQLVSLCRSCHQAVHDKYGRKGDYFPID